MTSPTPLDQLVDQLARRNTGIVRAYPGDTLVLLMPGDDQPIDPDQPGDTPATRTTDQLAELLPDVSVIVITGCAGGVVVGHAAPALDDEYHRTGVYCGEPAHCTEPYPGALPGTPYPAPANHVTEPNGPCEPGCLLAAPHFPPCAVGLCCDLHGVHCEPPAELCCTKCTEAAHPRHPRGAACVLNQA